jgi:hypothetical protein
LGEDVAGVSGSVGLAERVNQTTLVTINLWGTTAGGIHQHTYMKTMWLLQVTYNMGLNAVRNGVWNKVKHK